MWVQTSDTNINTKPIVLCTSQSGTVTLIETTTDTKCTSGTITDATSGGEKWFKNCRKNAFVEKYPSGHIKKNCQICKKYILNIIFIYENIYRCINANLTYSLHVIKKNHNRIYNRISYTML